MKAAIYCRLSKEDMDKMVQGDESGSIQNQKLLLRAYAQAHGFAIYEVYCDEDYSGLDHTRPSFLNMIADAKAGKFEIILCKSQARFTRDRIAVEKYLHGLFPQWGVRFIGVVDHVDTADLGAGKKSRQIHALVNEWYCEDLSENIKSVLRAKKENGQFVGAFAPYGYKKSPENRHCLEVDNEVAWCVQRIFASYLEGASVSAICGALNAEGILSPSAYKRKDGYVHPQAQERWGVSTIKKILHDEVYIGTLVQGKEEKLSYRSKRRVQVAKKDWIRVEGCHEAIVSREDFLAVQQCMQERCKCKGNRKTEERE